MTNDDYIQWEPLVHKVAWRYRNNSFKIEYDDLIQIGSIGLMFGLKSFDEEKAATITTYLFNCIQNEIFKEFQNLKRIKRQINYKTVTLNKIIDEENQHTLEDLVPDETIDIAKDAEDKIIIETYKKEFELILNKLELDVVNKRIFQEKTLDQSAKDLNFKSIERIRQIENKAYRKLRYKSPLIRNKWLELKERDTEKNIIDLYSNPERIVISNDISKKLKEKYKKELNVLSFLQTIFDELDSYFKTNNKIKDFLLSKLSKILDSKDIYLLDQVEFNKIDSDELLHQGFSYSDIFCIKSHVKKKIIANKELAFSIYTS